MIIWMPIWMSSHTVELMATFPPTLSSTCMYMYMQEMKHYCAKPSAH